MIPHDWRCLAVADVAARRPNSIVGGPFGSDLVSNDYVAQGTPVIRGQNMGDFRVGGDFVFVSFDKAKSLRPNTARPLDVIFTQRGTLGQVSLVPTDSFDSYIVSQSQMKLSVDLDNHNPQYICHFFSSDLGQKQILESAIQTGVPHTNLGILKSYILPSPPRNEQRAIAEALSDADQLIEGLERLIAKKRDIKQAAMQHLLTGKTRLPGFGGEWKQRHLGEIADIVGGGTPSSSVPSYWDGGIPWCTPTDITSEPGKHLYQTARTITEAGLNASAAVLLPKGALLLCTRATIGEVKIAGVPICTNQGFKALICRNGVNNEYLYYRVLSMEAVFVGKSSGSTFLELSKKDISSIGIKLPTSEEQKAIATVLSDMDAEIAALEARRDKARQVKQGMMQELLTGRIRLV